MIKEVQIENLLFDLHSATDFGYDLRNQILNHQQREDGKTLLILAAEHGLPRTVENLIELGADITIRDFDGLTARDNASSFEIMTRLDGYN